MSYIYSKVNFFQVPNIPFRLPDRLNELLQPILKRIDCALDIVLHLGRRQRI